MSRIFDDLQSCIRALGRRPLHTGLTLLVLALGLSATMAVLTYINGFYQPFPGVDTEGLIRVFGSEAERPYADISYLDFLDYAEANGAFEGLAATQPFYAASVRHETMTEVAFLEAVSGGYFSVLGIETALGRGLRPDDDRHGADPAAVISHAWWLRSFGGDTSVIGSTIYLNFRPFTLVGVTSPDFLGTTSSFRPDVWIPIAPFADRYVGWARQAEDRDLPLIRVFARLRQGLGEEQGLGELGAIAAGLDEVYPRQGEPRGIRLEPATWIDPRTRLAEMPTVRLMIVAAGVLLLLVCANVANMLLSVSTSRQHELSMRAALGASPGRLLRQVLTENVALSAAAGALALVLAGPVGDRLGSYFARPSVWGENVAREASVDLRVVLFALAISLITGVLAGLLPALRAARQNLADTLKTQASQPIRGPLRFLGWRIPGLADGLVAIQVALSVMLLVVAGLVIRTLVSVKDLDPGFSYEQVVVTHISTSSTLLKIDERDRFFREVARRVAERPWARAATVADFPPLSPHASAELTPDGQTDPVPLIYSKVIPGFFEALGIEVLRGRTFADADTIGARDVAVVNELLARRFFADGDAVGGRIRWPDADGETDRVFEIVGVVADMKMRDFLAEAEPTVYFSYPQHGYPTGSALLVSASGDPAAAVPLLSRWLRDFEPHLAIVNVVPYNEIVRGFLYTHRMNAEMFAALAFLGLALASVGIFSVVSLAVARRTREIGIRTAIGAQRSDIRRVVITRTMTPVALGLALGLAISFALTDLVRSLLYGVEPNDPLTLAAGVGVLLVAALAAAYLPARRALAVDPVVILRDE